MRRSESDRYDGGRLGLPGWCGKLIFRVTCVSNYLSIYLSIFMYCMYVCMNVHMYVCMYEVPMVSASIWLMALSTTILDDSRDANRVRSIAG